MRFVENFRREFPNTFIFGSLALLVTTATLVIRVIREIYMRYYERK